MSKNLPIDYILCKIILDKFDKNISCFLNEYPSAFLSLNIKLKQNNTLKKYIRMVFHLCGFLNGQKSCTIF